MRLVRLLSLLPLASLPVSLVAQIPTRKPPSAATAPSNAPRLLVANPYSFVSQDSVLSVAVGQAIRTRMDKIVGASFFVIPREQMNDALKQFSYPLDAILTLPVQKTFAASLQARTLVASTLAKEKDGGRYTLTARFSGLNDDAGNVVSLVQSAGQKPEDLGAAVADGLEPAVKSFNDARACTDQAKTAPEKAIAAAKKAIAVMPKHGTAHLCLAQIALSKATKKDSLEAAAHLRDAVVGDPLSLTAWTKLAEGYEAAGDTTKTVEALQQMLLIAPTNQPLRETAFKVFLRYERPEAAEQAAEEGLKLDPTNADLWDLLANARVYRGNFAGAVDALEQVVVNDSTKADSSFFLKITVMASQKPDTSRLLRWARQGVNKYPNNVELLKQLLTAYSLTGETDSAVAVTSRLMKTDTTATTPALVAAKALQDAKRPKESLPFIEFAAKYGDPQTKENAAGLMLNATLPLLQPPQDWPAAAEGMRQVVKAADPAGRYAPIANYFLGFSLLQQIAAADPEAEKQKSCELAKSEDTMSQEAVAAFGQTKDYQPDNVAKFMKYLDGLKPRIASMQRVYCK
jgi:tetratricopeptide (TPR) repeat protein